MCSWPHSLTSLLPQRRPKSFGSDKLRFMMDATIDRVLKQIDSSQAESLAGLKDFLRIPSVSTKPEHAQDLQRCAQWLAGEIREAEIDVEIQTNQGPPILPAQKQAKAGPKNRTL